MAVSEEELALLEKRIKIAVEPNELNYNSDSIAVKCELLSRIIELLRQNGDNIE